MSGCFNAPLAHSTGRCNTSVPIWKWRMELNETTSETVFDVDSEERDLDALARGGICQRDCTRVAAGGGLDSSNACQARRDRAAAQKACATGIKARGARRDLSRDERELVGTPHCSPYCSRALDDHSRNRAQRRANPLPRTTSRCKRAQPGVASQGVRT